MNRLICQLMLVGMGVAFAPLVQAEEVKVNVIQVVRVTPVLNPHLMDAPVTTQPTVPHCYRVENVRNVTDTQQLTQTAMSLMTDNKNLPEGSLTSFDTTAVAHDTACADEGK